MKQELSPEHRVALIQYRFERAYKTLEEADVSAAMKKILGALEEMGIELRQ